MMPHLFTRQRLLHPCTPLPHQSHRSRLLRSRSLHPPTRRGASVFRILFLIGVMQLVAHRPTKRPSPRRPQILHLSRKKLSSLSLVVPCSTNRLRSLFLLL